KQVVAVDVGYGLLHERVAGDPRVEVRDRTNVRDLVLDEPVDLVVADLSFISLRTVLPALLGAARPGATMVLLVKPQFEATREEADRGRGVIRDPAVWRRVLHEVEDALRARGAAIMGAMVSPLHGADGNVEFVLHVRAPSPGDPGSDHGDGDRDGAGTPGDHPIDRHPGLDVDALVREATG
ncbi:MAG TPA: SAM-dependent methyltransferase, partial [Acidimicrobiales bacterium]